MRKYIFIALLVLAGSASAWMLWQSRPASPDPLRQVEDEASGSQGGPQANVPASDVGAVKGTAIQEEIFVDVRTNEEWGQGHLDGALHFDLAKLQQGQYPDLPKDAPIALYCRSGNRAGQALQILSQNGFTNVRNAGGFADLSQTQKTCLGPLASCN